MRYTIRKANNGSKILQINGRDCLCPFRSPLMMEAPTKQHLIGGAEPTAVNVKLSEPCGDTCPLFALHVGYSVALHCGKGREILLTGDKLTAQA